MEAYVTLPSGSRTLVVPAYARKRAYYFETSAWDALQRRGGLSSDWGELLGRATKAHEFAIVAGVIVFEETLPLYKEYPDLGDNRLEVIEGLADLSRTIALSTDILRQHVISALCGATPPPPYSDQYRDLSSARRLIAQNRNQIADLTAPNYQKDLENLVLAQASRDWIRSELKKSSWPKLTFEKFCELEKSSFQSYIDYLFGQGKALPAEALRPLQGSKPLRMYRDGLLALLYLHAVRNRSPKASDLRDLHHAVAASVTDGLVTNDSDLEEWSGLVAIPDFRVYKLPEFVAAVGARSLA